MQTITLNDHTFELLVRFASVGRTIDAAVQTLDKIADEELVEQAEFTAMELRELKNALTECGNAAKTRWWELNPTGLPKEVKDGSSD